MQSTVTICKILKSILAKAQTTLKMQSVREDLFCRNLTLIACRTMPGTINRFGTMALRYGVI